MLPGVYIIHQLNPFTPCYMTPNGLELLGISLEELKEIGTDYHKLFFNNDEMEDYLQKMHNLLANADANESFISYDPVGFSFGVMPLNYPFLQVMSFAVPPLTAGKTIILKHASNFVGCTLML